MSKVLIIAEKPSVATDLSKALAPKLGKFTKKGKSRDSQHFENDSALITSAVGHLVELKMPTGPNGKNLPWKFEVLPAIPKNFELQPIERTEARLKHILGLAKKKDVDLIVNACDAGREGELIFQYIMDIGEIQKPVKRLWMQSMTTQAIQDAWDKLRDGEEMKDLSDAAKCRSESDWLVGLNSTRALTCFRSRHGGFNITGAGRVQTPTLAILARREREIKDFVSEDYWEVHADFAVTNGEYESRWVDLGWKKDEENKHSKAERIWDRAKAESIQLRCQGKTGSVSEEKKPQKQIAPQLYDLTTLQREAPFTARNTLAIAQALYERHKMVTYPRTDSRYLPEDYVKNVIETTQQIASSGLPVAKWAEDSLKNNRIQFNKRIFNNTKVSDHFAIIPTGRVVKLAKEQEQKVYDMIVKRFIAIFFPHAEFEVTKRITSINHGAETDNFRTDGKILVVPGWLGVYGRKAGVAAGKDDLVAVTDGETAEATDVRLEDKQTNPPARYTESTLLAAMEGAGKLLDDDELREAMSDRGLGTPATRAAIIERILKQEYVVRDGRDLIVTGKGLRLIELLEDMKIKPLTSPSMTGEWEAKLHRMEKGELSRDVFMREIAGFTEDVVLKARNHYTEAVNRSFPDLECTCPRCGAPVLKTTDATYECYNLINKECDFRISKYLAGRKLSEEEAKQLFTTKFLEEKEGYISRFNVPFAAAVELVQTESKTGKKGKYKTNFVFDQDEPESADDLDDEDIIANIALPGGSNANVYETEKSFMVPDFKPKESPDGFRLGKTILQKELSKDDVIPLFQKGKTELLPGFISRKTKRPFSAHLTLDFETGKIGFEFAPRKKGPSKKAAGKS
ncbi:MAG: DNA topoisomerase III [Verrucomicrobiales bacterium]|nr:DNA topoisomerase III [Verrucomicrobiales bacterium]